MNTIKNILYTILMGLVFLGSMLIGTQANAQSWDGTHIYAPQYTKHYAPNRMYAVQANGSEGGSEGFLITRSSKGMHFTMGIMQNSYGDFSKYAMFGLSIKEGNKGQLSAHAGIADNYGKAYCNWRNAETLHKYLGETMARERYMPLVSLTYKHRITKRVGIQVNVSPMFVNTGLYVQL